MYHTLVAVADVATRLHLHRAGNSWRGNCPLCGYRGAFVLQAGRDGRPIGWCASCQDSRGIADLLRDAGGGRWQPRPAAERQDDDAPERLRRRIERARNLWAMAVPAAGTPADRYLTTRGLPRLAESAPLRFIADCPHPAGGRLPALIAAVVDVQGDLVAVHRTFLRPDGNRKADFEPAKATLGAVWAAAIRLDEVAPEIVVGEGLETSASAGRLLGLPAWAATSAGNLAAGLVLPPEVRAVVVAADADEPGERAARAAALRWQRLGLRVRIARPAAAGHDFNDVARARVREVVA